MNNRLTHILILISFALLNFLFLKCSSPFEPDVEGFADPESEILKEINANNIPSLAAWIVKEDSIVWEKYYGYSDINSNRLADRNTVYGLASISKLVIVTAVMQLYEQGLIDLHTDINNYIPFEVRNPNYPDDIITPYHLLTHTSGLSWPRDEYEVPGYYTHYPFDSAPPLSEWLPEFIQPEGVHYVPSVWKNSHPGEREEYSNIGTALLAYAVEVISNVDFSEYCRQNIFVPLEMFNTSHNYSDLDMNNLATLYEEPKHPIGFYRYRCYPSGDLKTTIEDFSHFIIAYMNGGQYKNIGVLKESTVQQILTIQNPASGICLIWDCSVGDWLGHTGGKPGVATCVEFQRETKVALMIATNYHHSSVHPGNKIHALVRRIAQNYY
jgi:CubicO group peptidase (beta-lactamase class C family)